MRALALLAALLAWSAAGAQAPDASVLLQRADDIRNPGESFRMKVDVTTGSETATFEVQLKGKDKTLIRTLAPARDKGRNLLMLGDEMWAYVPNLKRSIRVSLSQKLTGEAANGDIARMRWAGDYDAKLEEQDEKSWTLALRAQRKGLTYDRARVVIEKGTSRPVTAEYLTLSGAVLKRASFRDYKEIAGAVRPTTIEITDATRQDRVSVIAIREMEAKAFKDSEFQQSNLP